MSTAGVSRSSRAAWSILRARRDASDVGAVARCPPGPPRQRKQQEPHETCHRDDDSAIVTVMWAFAAAGARCMGTGDRAWAARAGNGCEAKNQCGGGVG